MSAEQFGKYDDKVKQVLDSANEIATPLNDAIHTFLRMHGVNRRYGPMLAEAVMDHVVKNPSESDEVRAKIIAEIITEVLVSRDLYEPGMELDFKKIYLQYLGKKG